MKKVNIRPGPFNAVGFFFSIAGFILVLLCLVGCLKPSGRGLYFAKVTNAAPLADGSSVAFYYGWQGYCVEDTELKCYADRSMMVVPFDVVITTQLNESYPELFTDPITQDEALNPASTPSPAHDPKIYHAAVLCLICSSVLLGLCLLRTCSPYSYQDEYHSRGFLASGATVLALLLLILSSIMYENATEQLNLEYPHLIASIGPALTMIGVGFACFTIAAYSLLRGCMTTDSSSEGYSPI
ncbi:hypothetical protein HPULCUR_000169 [Helicostylum pulchrum]|uniref:Uncharacterized protein n=1 Tax=Helicostylum pulchrum TaxID=562976 RepID=A0ABP9XJ35_9FUNG